MTVFVSVRTAEHSAAWLEEFARAVSDLPEVVEFYRMAGEIDYLLKVGVADIKAYDRVYKRLIERVRLVDVSAAFAMEEIKNSTGIPSPRYCGSVTIAFHATMFADVAIASVAAAVHKDRAFQASSPKNFSAGPLTGLFFGRDFPYGKHASSADNQQESESGVEAAGKTGNGMAIGLGLSDSGVAPPDFPWEDLVFRGCSAYQARSYSASRQGLPPFAVAQQSGSAP